MMVFNSGYGPLTVHVKLTLDPSFALITRPFSVCSPGAIQMVSSSTLTVVVGQSASSDLSWQSKAPSHFFDRLMHWLSHENSASGHINSTRQKIKAAFRVSATEKKKERKACI